MTQVSRWDWVPALAGCAIGLSLYAVALALKGTLWLYNKAVEPLAIPPL